MENNIQFLEYYFQHELKRIDYQVYLKQIKNPNKDFSRLSLDKLERRRNLFHDRKLQNYNIESGKFVKKLDKNTYCSIQQIKEVNVDDFNSLKKKQNQIYMLQKGENLHLKYQKYYIVPRNGRLVQNNDKIYILQQDEKIFFYEQQYFITNSKQNLFVKNDKLYLIPFNYVIKIIEGEYIVLQKGELIKRFQEHQFIIPQLAKVFWMNNQYVILKDGEQIEWIKHTNMYLIPQEGSLVFTEGKYYILQQNFDVKKIESSIYVFSRDQNLYYFEGGYFILQQSKMNKYEISNI